MCRTTVAIFISVFLLPAAAAGLDAQGSAAPAAGKTSQLQPQADAAEAGQEQQDSSKQAPARKQPETVLEFAVAGGVMMIPLSLASVAIMAFLIERILVLRRKNIIPQALADRLKGILNAKPVDVASAQLAVREHPSAASRILTAVFERLGSERREIESVVNDVAQAEGYQMRRNVWLFAVISSLGPLMGLLGTVAGLVQAFREVAINGLGSGATLAPGIYEALVTTVAGLAVAIPAIFIYYAINARVDSFLFEIDRLVAGFVNASDRGRA